MLYTKTVIKKQEAKRLLSNLGIKTPLSKSAFAPFAKNKKTIHKLKETGHAKYICRNESDKVFFFNMAWLMEILKT